MVLSSVPSSRRSSAVASGWNKFKAAVKRVFSANGEKASTATEETATSGNQSQASASIDNARAQLNGNCVAVLLGPSSSMGTSASRRIPKPFSVGAAQSPPQSLFRSVSAATSFEARDTPLGVDLSASEEADSAKLRAVLPLSTSAPQASRSTVMPLAQRFERISHQSPAIKSRRSNQRYRAQRGSNGNGYQQYGPHSHDEIMMLDVSDPDLDDKEDARFDEHFRLSTAMSVDSNACDSMELVDSAPSFQAAGALDASCQLAVTADTLRNSQAHVSAAGAVDQRAGFRVTASVHSAAGALSPIQECLTPANATAAPGHMLPVQSGAPLGPARQIVAMSPEAGSTTATSTTAHGAATKVVSVSTVPRIASGGITSLLSTPLERQIAVRNASLASQSSPQSVSALSIEVPSTPAAAITPTPVRSTSAQLLSGSPTTGLNQPGALVLLNAAATTARPIMPQGLAKPLEQPPAALDRDSILVAATPLSGLSRLLAMKQSATPAPAATPYQGGFSSIEASSPLPSLSCAVSPAPAVCGTSSAASTAGSAPIAQSDRAQRNGMQGTVERAKASLASAWQQASPATDSRLTRTPVAVQRNTHGTHDKAAHITSNAKHAGLSPASLAATALAATAGLHSHIAKLQAARASLSVLTSSPPMVYRTSVLQSTTKRSGPDATVLATPRAYATEQASTRSDVRRPVYTTAFSACMTDSESDDSDERLSVHPSFSAPAGPASAVSMGARSASRRGTCRRSSRTKANGPS